MIFFLIANAWTVSGTNNPNRSILNGNFTGELELPSQENDEILNRVDLLEKEVKGRDTEIRDLNDRVDLNYFRNSHRIRFDCSCEL